MKTFGWRANFVLAGFALLAAGCVERRVEYVPVYQQAPTAQPQSTYGYPPQTAYANPAVAGTVDTNAPAIAPPAAPPGPAAPPPEAQMAPPPPQSEVVPVAPGPNYYWSPGYWTWNGGVWVWVRGGFVVRPWRGAVWVGGRWVPRGRGWVWAGGHWR